MKDALATRSVPRSQTLILVALLGLAVAPHVANLSLWITGFYYFLTGFRMLAVRFKNLMPSRITRFALTILALVNVGMHAGFTDNHQGGVSLLVAMVGLKLLELRSRRDVYMVVFLGYFVIVTQFLFSQSLLLAVYLSAILAAMTGLLVAMNRARRDAPLAPAFKQSIRLLGAAIPAMLVMFVLFPRLSGPLWGIGFDSKGSITGMSDQIRLGSISQLSQSSATAFRVKFDQELPPTRQRYWRGVVLWQADGHTWRAGNLPNTGEIPLLEVYGAPLTYEVTLEATQRNWLFVLDFPQVPPNGAQLSSDLVTTANSPVKKRITYRTEAWPTGRVVEIGDQERQLGLQLPPTITERMRSLVGNWRRQSRSDAELVDTALAYFRTQPFVYTLAPPPLGERPEDEFLFDTRQGFCEHYATSFTLLMRLAGIPTRVVAGYQGGEFNPHGNHLIVRQSDAHAWTEVWLPEYGWKRIDPTAAVAPSRINHAITDTASREGAPVIFELEEGGTLFHLMREARWLADSFELGWHRWVVGFSRERQRGLLADLGFGGLGAYSQALLAVGLGALAMAAGALLLRLLGEREKDPVRDAYRRLQWRLRKAGLHVAPWLGPRDLKRAAQSAFPDRSADLGRIFDSYITLRYGKSSQSKKAIRRFRFSTLRLRLPKIAARTWKATQPRL